MIARVRACARMNLRENGKPRAVVPRRIAISILGSITLLDRARGIRFFGVRRGGVPRPAVCTARNIIGYAAGGRMSFCGVPLCADNKKQPEDVDGVQKRRTTMYPRSGTRALLFLLLLLPDTRAKS